MPLLGRRRRIFGRLIGVDAADRLRAASGGPHQAIQSREFLALARRIVRAAGALKCFGQRETRTRAVGGEPRRGLQLSNRAFDIAGIEERVTKRLMRPE